MASSRSMNQRRRNRPPKHHTASPAPHTPLPALDEITGPIVLLAFIAAGLKREVARHAEQVRKDFEERIDSQYRWPEEVAKLEELRLFWRPMSVEVEPVPLPAPSRMVAPRIVLTSSSTVSTERGLHIFLCRRGLVVLETIDWPVDVRAPAILKDPDSVESAARNASATVRAVISSMGRHNHPLDMT